MTPEQQKYIDDKMKMFAMNIDEFSIGQIVVDADGAQCKITNKTANSIEVFINKKIYKCQTCAGKGKVKRDELYEEQVIISVPHKNFILKFIGIMSKESKTIKKSKTNTLTCETCDGAGKTSYGVDCTQWFDMRSFNDTFKKLKQ